MRRSRRSAGPDSSAYAMVALIVVVAVMNVVVAASLPYWSKVVQRDKEAELIFRGLQYAEAIRVFQARFNRLPNTLDELIEVNPRSIRRLWKEPMSDDGEWELIRGQAGNQPGGEAGRDLTQASGPDEGARARRGRGRRRQQAGPIIGVRSTSEGEGMRQFMGSSSYSSWLFTADLIPVPVAIPDTLLVPRPTSEYIGKPFRDDLQPKQGAAPRDLLAGPESDDDDG